MSPFKFICCALVFVFGLLPVATAQAEKVLSPTAKQHFDAGIAYLDDPAGAKLEEAYNEFRIAYENSPTYLILANIGYCALFLERDGEAIEAYEGYLAKATPKDISPKKREQMQRDVEMLKASLVRVKYETTPKSVMITDERVASKGANIVNSYAVTTGTLEIGIHPGHHRITATAEGFEPQTWDQKLDSASVHSHAFRLKPLASANAAANGAPSAGSGLRSDPNAGAATNATGSASSNLDVTLPTPTQKRSMTPAYVGLVATGVFAASATVTGILTLSTRSNYDSVNRDGSQPEKAQGLRDDVRLYGLFTDIGIGAAVLSAGATAYFYFSASSSKPEKPTSTARVQLAPAFSYSTAGLSLSGKF